MIFMITLQLNIVYGMISTPFVSFNTSNERVFTYIFMYGLGGIISFFLFRLLVTSFFNEVIIDIEYEQSVLKIKKGMNDKYEIPLADLSDIEIKINNNSIKSNKIISDDLVELDNLIRSFISDLTFRKTGITLIFVVKNKKPIKIERICIDDYTKIRDLVMLSKSW